jgi:hypothetical protein
LPDESSIIVNPPETVVAQLMPKHRVLSFKPQPDERLRRQYTRRTATRVGLATCESIINTRSERLSRT